MRPTVSLRVPRRRPRRVTAYWWVGVANFGDLLTGPLLKHFSEVDVQWAAVADAQIAGVGSIIEHIPNGWAGKIVGAGKLREESAIPVGRNQILALRGPLTAKGVRGDFALGDPGLLAGELVQVETKRHELGIVPHWSDTELATDPRFATYHPKIIDPHGDPLDVIRAIGECRKIVSSSLHGIILADSFGIPRRIEYTHRFDREGGDFKFRDYSEAIRTPLKIGETVLANRQAVDDRKSELYDCLRSLVP